MDWYAGRSVYFWGQKSDGTNVFEERVVAFAAHSEPEAHAKARAEAEAYCHHRQDISYQRHPELVLYRLDDVPLAHGAEVWSEMFEARESLEQFYANRYQRYEYHPDEPSESRLILRRIILPSSARNSRSRTAGLG